MGLLKKSWGVARGGWSVKGQKGTPAGRRAAIIADLRTKRDELARLVEVESDPARKEIGQRELDKFDRRIARLERKKFAVPLPVIIALVQAIVMFIQWWLSKSSS